MPAATLAAPANLSRAPVMVFHRIDKQRPDSEVCLTLRHVGCELRVRGTSGNFRPNFGFAAPGGFCGREIWPTWGSTKTAPRRLRQGAPQGLCEGRNRDISRQ